MNRIYNIYRENLVTGSSIYSFHKDGYNIKSNEYKKNAFFELRKINQNKEIINIDLCISGIISKFLVIREMNKITINDREVFTKGKSYFFQELLYNYNSIDTISILRRHKSIQIWDDSLSSINLYDIYEIDQYDKLIIKPIPANIKFNNIGLLEKYECLNNYKIMLDKGE